MNKKTISPNPQQPVDRKPAGKLPEALAELSEAALSSDGAHSSFMMCSCKTDPVMCSYDGGDDE